MIIKNENCLFIISNGYGYGYGYVAEYGQKAAKKRTDSTDVQPHSGNRTGDYFFSIITLLCEHMSNTCAKCNICCIHDNWVFSSIYILHYPFFGSSFSSLFIHIKLSLKYEEKMKQWLNIRSGRKLLKKFPFQSR